MRQVSQTLDDEHRATLALLGRAEAAFNRAGREDAEERARVARALARFLEDEIGRHFVFEEQVLFPRLVDAGDGDLALLLTEEHVPILQAAAEALPLARLAAAGTIDAPGLQALQRGISELAERLDAHIQKETAALLPVLDDLLDDETDRALVLEYVA
jgi:hemerythrin-like domain-containing protein